MSTNKSLLCNATGQDVDILARTIFGEARGETWTGQVAVAWVIVHRAQIAEYYVKQHYKPHPLYGNGSFKSACLAENDKGVHQFSCWNKSDPNRPRLLSLNLTQREDFDTCYDVARAVLTGRAEDRLPGTTHYYNPANVKVEPAWAKGLVGHAIGNHLFFLDVP